MVAATLVMPAAGDGPARALAELRRARRVRRMGDTTFGDVAYRVYVTALLSLFAVFTASGWVGDDTVSASTAHDIARDAPPWLGLLAALAVLGGVRAGSRGGPLAIEAPDVYHVLLAPIDRGAVLRRPLSRSVASAALWGALGGALAGDLAGQRLPGDGLAWVASGGLAGATGAILTVGAALLVAGRSIPRFVPLPAALALVAWSIADVADRGVPAPATVLGRIGVWAIDFDAAGVAAPMVAIAIVGAAAMTIGGLSIEAARRRTALVGQLRFAVTQQDLRTVLVLRRQLANEVMRARPRFPSLAGRPADALPVLTRDLQNLARWPLVRIGRVAGLGVVAGLCMRGVWSGTTPLVLVAGLASFVAALDAIEPLAQDLDRPTRLASYPRPDGWVLARHLVGPTIVMVLVGGVALATAVVVDPSSHVAALGAMAIVPAALAAVAGAAVSVVSEPMLDASTEAMIPPEIGGPRVLLRAAWPPAIAVIGLLPVITAHRAERAGDPAAPVLLGTAVSVVVLAAAVAAWVRFRADIHAAITNPFSQQTSGTQLPSGTRRGSTSR
jgi:hypothetical protein